METSEKNNTLVGGGSVGSGDTVRLVIEPDEGGCVADVTIPTASVVKKHNEVEITEDAAQTPATSDVAPASVQDESNIPALFGTMAIGDVKFGITCTGEPVGRSHWLADSAVCGDLVMALPSSVLIAGRTKEASGVAVDMGVFLDAIVEGASRLCGIPGIVEASGLPAWSVSRLMGTFPALMQVYHETIDQAVLLVEAAAIKASIGMRVTNRREHTKNKSIGGKVVESDKSVETLDREIPPDPSLSRFILTNRMKSRYKDDGDVKQAVQINIMGAEADL